jgi:5-deoxy-glucuronate isomerase
VSTQNILIRSNDDAQTDVIINVSSEQAGWDLLNMTARRMNKGQIWRGETGNHEYVHVVLGGVCHVRTSQGEFLNVGRRSDVFGGMPYAVYLSRNIDFEVEAVTEGFELASCWVPTDEDHPARLVTPSDSQIDLRGGGNASRQVNTIIPPGFDCHRIVCVEAYIPGGNWAGYPPHKHDEHREDENGQVLEADLEEIYFFKMNRPGGYVFQRVYTEDRRINQVAMAQHNDVVLVPEGYHPTVSIPGYTTYLLNFLAGSAQSLANSDDPTYSWVKEEWGQLDPRLPIVDHSMEPSN